MTGAEWGFLCANLETTDRLLEFGSGQSTKEFAKRVAEVHSVEHQQKWFHRISRQCELIPNVNIHLVQARHYTAVLDQLPTFDVVVIDGRFRNRCGVEVINNLKVRHSVFVHDWFRRQYHRLLEHYEIVAQVQDLVQLRKK